MLVIASITQLIKNGIKIKGRSRETEKKKKEEKKKKKNQ